MVANQKPTGRATSMPTGLAFGGLISLISTVIFSAVIAFLAEKEIIPETSIGYGVMVLLFISAITGSIAANAKIQHRKLMVCLLSACIYYGILLAITALFFGGQYNGMDVTGLVIAAGSVLPVLLGGKGRGRHKSKSYKIASR